MAGIHVGGIDQCLKGCKTTLQQNFNILDYKQKFIGNNHVLLLNNIAKSVGSWGLSEYIIYTWSLWQRECALSGFTYDAMSLDKRLILQFWLYSFHQQNCVFHILHPILSRHLTKQNTVYANCASCHSFS